MGAGGWGKNLAATTAIVVPILPLHPAAGAVGEAAEPDPQGRDALCAEEELGCRGFWVRSPGACPYPAPPAPPPETGIETPTREKIERI